jgi:putative transposase
MIYIDMNMVRAGVVKHPKEWPCCGYNEIMGERQRYRMIDKKKLSELLNFKRSGDLKENYGTLVEIELRKSLVREEKWTESLAVGEEKYVQNVKERMGISALHRNIKEFNGKYVLKEQKYPYSRNFSAKIGLIKDVAQGSD